ncbi:MAG TPA: hypothetical protein VLJ39_00370 [Tepidisphaeraceae bacterium]|nr:hypothetical protein [Tepidisphaeraceae bacterium]
MRQLMELSIELQRERDALASRLTRGSSIISTGKALLDVGPSNMEIREPETAGDSDWEGGGSPRSSQ